MPNSSLSVASSTRFSMFGISSPKALMRVSPRGALHERVQVGTEQVQPGIGEAPEVAGFQGGARDDKRAAERSLVAGLAVAVVGHVLRPGRAHVVLDRGAV